MLTEGTYRTEVSASFKLSGVYIAPLVSLWWTIVVCEAFLDFRNLGIGTFFIYTPPYAVHFSSSTNLRSQDLPTQPIRACIMITSCDRMPSLMSGSIDDLALIN